MSEIPLTGGRDIQQIQPSKLAEVSRPVEPAGLQLTIVGKTPTQLQNELLASFKSATSTQNLRDRNENDTPRDGVAERIQNPVVPTDLTGIVELEATDEEDPHQVGSRISYVEGKSDISGDMGSTTMAVTAPLDSILHAVHSDGSTQNFRQNIFTNVEGIRIITPGYKLGADGRQHALPTLAFIGSQREAPEQLATDTNEDKVKTYAARTAQKIAVFATNHDGQFGEPLQLFYPFNYPSLIKATVEQITLLRQNSPDDLNAAKVAEELTSQGYTTIRFSDYGNILDPKCRDQSYFETIFPQCINAVAWSEKHFPGITPGEVVNFIYRAGAEANPTEKFAVGGNNPLLATYSHDWDGTPTWQPPMTPADQITLDHYTVAQPSASEHLPSPKPPVTTDDYLPSYKAEQELITNSAAQEEHPPKRKLSLLKWLRNQRTKIS